MSACAQCQSSIHSLSTLPLIRLSIQRSKCPSLIPSTTRYPLSFPYCCEGERQSVELRPLTGPLSISRWHMSEYGAAVEWYWQAKTEGLGEKPVPVPLCPPQIPVDCPGSETGPPRWEVGGYCTFSSIPHVHPSYTPSFSESTNCMPSTAPHWRVQLIFVYFARSPLFVAVSAFYGSADDRCLKTETSWLFRI
jgi:hypothetical protein